jgi:hypothetical protein
VAIDLTDQRWAHGELYMGCLVGFPCFIQAKAVQLLLFYSLHNLKQKISLHEDLQKKPCPQHYQPYDKINKPLLGQESGFIHQLHTIHSKIIIFSYSMSKHRKSDQIYIKKEITANTRLTCPL